MLTFVSGTIFYISRRSFNLFYFIILEIRKYLNSICFKRPGSDQLWLSNPTSPRVALYLVEGGADGEGGHVVVAGGAADVHHQVSLYT